MTTDLGIKLFFASLYIGLGVFIYNSIQFDKQHPPICQEWSSVKTILSVDYRDATVLMENGKILTINQGHVKPGTKMCLNWTRKP